MNILSGIDAASAAVDRARESVRRGIASVVIALVGIVILACAAGFAIAAVHMWLATQMPAYVAALYVAAGLALIGGAVLVIASGRRGPRRPVRRPVPPSPEVAAEMAADSTMRAAASQVNRHPAASVLTALALGVVVGLLKPSDKP